MGTVDVAATLKAAELDETVAAKLNPGVNRDEAAEIDPGNMLVSDARTPGAEIRKPKQRESWLSDTTRENTQILINAIWQLPIERKDGIFLAKLPEPSYNLPRAKPVPEKKKQTKWEEYAAGKGIQKKKRSRMILDDATGEYKPRFGYKSANNDEPAWIELSNQADPYEDQFEKRANAKTDRVDKNNKQRLRNLSDTRQHASRATTFKEKSQVKEQLKSAFAISKFATASVGKFDDKLKNEPKVKARPGNKAQQRPPVTQHSSIEKEKSLSILKKIAKKPVTMQTGTGTALADNQHPGAVSFANKGDKKKGGKRPAMRVAPKGPSKRMKKAT
eukprot:m.16991 g.16991  ORF g.16991 m.16991 type:complete len:332 (-) comp11293_c0_seq1:548-1543(-)